MKEQLLDEPVQKVLFPWYMPTLGIYLQAQRDTIWFAHPYNPIKINSSFESKKKQLNEKILSLNSSKINETRKAIKKIKFERKIAQKKIKKDKQIDLGNWAMRAVGEVPPIFSYEEMYTNQKNITNYLHSIGYLNASVNADVNFKNRRVHF